MSVAPSTVAAGKGYDPAQWPLQDVPVDPDAAGKGGSTLEWFSYFEGERLPPGLDPVTVLGVIPDAGRPGKTIQLNDVFTITQNFQYAHDEDFNPVVWGAVTLVEQGGKVQLPIVANTVSKVRPQGTDLVLPLMFQWQPGPTPALVLMPIHQLLASAAPFLFPATSSSPPAMFMAMCPGMAGTAMGAISIPDENWSGHATVALTWISDGKRPQVTVDERGNPTSVLLPALRTWSTTAADGDKPQPHYSVWPSPDDAAVKLVTNLKTGRVTGEIKGDKSYAAWFYQALLTGLGHATFTQHNLLQARFPQSWSPKNPNDIWGYHASLHYVAVWGGTLLDESTASEGAQVEVLDLYFGESAPCFQALYPEVELSVVMTGAKLVDPEDAASSSSSSSSSSSGPAYPLPTYTLTYVLPQRYWVVPNTYMLQSKEKDLVLNKPRPMFIQVRPTASYGSNIYYYFEEADAPPPTSSERTPNATPLEQQELVAQAAQGTIIGVGVILIIVLTVALLVPGVRALKASKT